jgi:ribonuclease P protein component
MQLRFVANKTRLHSRFAVVVSKKVSKQAVYRNRMRRRVFEVIRTDFDDIELAWDVSITIFSAEVLTLPYDELKTELSQLMTQAGLLEK